MEKVVATTKHTHPGRVYKRTKKGWTSRGVIRRWLGVKYFTDAQVEQDIQNGYLKKVK